MKFMLIATNRDISKYLSELCNKFNISMETFACKTGIPMQDFERNEYVIELNDLQDLLKLKEICGEELIIRNVPPYYNDDLLTIEIYNDYRE